MSGLVLPVRKGGLGNQMFQVAAALIYAHQTGRSVLLPMEHHNTHRTQQSDYADSIFSALPQRVNMGMDDIAIALLVHSGFMLHPEKPTFEAWKPRQDLSGNVILHGYFQYYPLLRPYEHALRELYVHGLKSFLEGLQPSVHRVGIHVRRGDYLVAPFNSVHCTQDESYYKKALALFQGRHIQDYWIFSDDIAWCKQQEIFLSLPHVIFVEKTDECSALAAMTTCQGGFICAASTFSWWGAFLGSYSVRNPCIVPSQWMKGHNTDNLFPTEWIRLD